MALGSGFGAIDEGSTLLENWIAKDEREPMPARFPGSVHNAAAAQIAIDLGAHSLNSAPTAGNISFEGALWQGMCQLAGDEADCALVGGVDELNKYPLFIGKRWGFWTEQTLPGEGAVLAQIVPDCSRRGDEADTQPQAPNPPPHVGGYLARVTTLRLGRYRRPFDAAREVDWMAAAVDLTKVKAIFSGAKGWPVLENNYLAVVATLNLRLGRELEHHTYKQDCGEFGAASAFGFAAAVEWVHQHQQGALLYTLSPRGGKAICSIEP